MPNRLEEKKIGLNWSMNKKNCVLEVNRQDVSVHEVKKHQCGGMQVFLAEGLVAGFRFRVLGVGAKPGVWA